MVKSTAQRAEIWQKVTDHVVRHTFGRPFGHLVNVLLNVISGQGWGSSPWQTRESSISGLVSIKFDQHIKNCVTRN